VFDLRTAGSLILLNADGSSHLIDAASVQQIVSAGRRWLQLFGRLERDVEDMCAQVAGAKRVVRRQHGLGDAAGEVDGAGVVVRGLPLASSDVTVSANGVPAVAVVAAVTLKCAARPRT
jgi:hypothetical protein